MRFLVTLRAALAAFGPLVLLTLLALLTLVGCCAPSAEPRMILKSPVWFDTQPVLVPQNFAMPVQQTQQFMLVPQAAPQAAPSCTAPAYTSGYQFAPAPQAAPRSCP